jgi:hypothetical protein
MLKRIAPLLVLVSAIGAALPGTAAARPPLVGHITGYNATSLSVRDKEILTVTLDDRTVYTRILTQKPWQADTTLNAGALGVGRFVAVHLRKNEPGVAEWVQIATDAAVAFAAAPSPALSAAAPGQPAAPTSKSDLLTNKQVRALIANAKTPADHVKLQKHFMALADKYEADATEHAADAAAYRKNPSFMDAKHPGNPGTAAHCDRFAELDREAAKEARDLASAHEHMAAAK